MARLKELYRNREILRKALLNAIDRKQEEEIKEALSELETKIKTAETEYKRSI